MTSGHVRRLLLLLGWSSLLLMAIVAMAELQPHDSPRTISASRAQPQAMMQLERWAQDHCGADYLRYRQVAAIYDLSGYACAYETGQASGRNIAAGELLQSEALWYWPTHASGAALPLRNGMTRRNALRVVDGPLGLHVSATIREPIVREHLPSIHPITTRTSRWNTYSDPRVWDRVFPGCVSGEDPDGYWPGVEWRAYDQALLTPILHYFLADQQQPATMSEALARFNLAPIDGRIESLREAGLVGIYRDSTQRVYGVRRIVNGLDWFPLYELDDAGFFHGYEPQTTGYGEARDKQRQAYYDQLTLWWDGTEASLERKAISAPSLP